MAQCRGGANITPRRSAVRKCGSPEAKENIDLRDQQRVLQAQLDNTLKHIEDVITTAQVQDQKILQVCIEHNQLQHDINRLQAQITDLDLQPGGILGNTVKNHLLD